MLTKLDSDPETLDDSEAKFVGSIRDFGFAITNVMPDDAGPGFNYTTGVWKGVASPEILVFSLSNENAGVVLWSIYDAAKEGSPIRIGTPTNEVFEHTTSMLLPISRDAYPDYLGWSTWFYCDADFPCVQLVIADRNNVFPWEPGFDEGTRFLQPDLTGGNWGGMA